MVTYFNEKDLVSFGNHILNFVEDEVTHADVKRWQFDMSLKKPKNFLETLEVNLDKVWFCTSPHFMFNTKIRQITHASGDDIRPINVAEYMNMSTAVLKKRIEQHDWTFFYIADRSKLMTNDMGMIEYLRCAFVNDDDFVHRKILVGVRYATLPQHIGINDELINKYIESVCAENDWERDGREYVLEDSGTAKVRFKIK